MAGLPAVASYKVGNGENVRLLKAQTCFKSAELLRERGNLCCAASRYYYAAVNVVQHYIGTGPDDHKIDTWELDKIKKQFDEEKRGEVVDYRGNWVHGAFAALYRTVDPEAGFAITRAYEARRIADYTRVLVSPEKLATVVSPVANMLERAFKREEFEVRRT